MPSYGRPRFVQCALLAQVAGALGVVRHGQPSSLVRLSAAHGRVGCPVGIGGHFPDSEADQCPTGWTCSDPHVMVRGLSSAGMTYIENLTTNNGAEPMVHICNDTQTGKLESDRFELPANAATLRFEQAGGANEPDNGVNVYNVNGTLLCYDGRSANTPHMKDVDCDISAGAGHAVYIEAFCTSTGGWTNVWVSNFRILDASGNDISDDIVCGDESDLVGDPHVVNAAMEHFEIRADGRHKLVQIPRSAGGRKELSLRVDAEITHLEAGNCDGTFVKDLTIYGNWTGAMGLVKVSAGSDAPRTALLVNTRPRFQDASVSFEFGGIAFHVAKHYEGRYGKQKAYLNLRVKGLSKHRDVGGLLGYDSHAEAEEPPAGCAPASLLGRGRSAARAARGSRIAVEA